MITTITEVFERAAAVVRNVLASGLAYPAGIPGQIVGAWRRGWVATLLKDIAQMNPALGLQIADDGCARIRRSEKGMPHSALAT